LTEEEKQEIVERVRLALAKPTRRNVSDTERARRVEMARELGLSSLGRRKALNCTCGSETHHWKCPAYVVVKMRERRERLRKERERESNA